MKTNLRIGEVLTEKGYVTEKQISQALAYQKEHRDKRVGQILMELGFVTEMQVLEALASRLQLRIVDVAQLVINIEAVAMIDKGLAEKNLILPVHVKDHNMQIVTNDPLNYFALEEVRQQSGCQLEILLSEEAPLKQAISYILPRSVPEELPNRQTLDSPHRVRWLNWRSKIWTTVTMKHRSSGF